MREFWILFKVSIINSFGLNRLKKKFSQKSSFLRIWVPIITLLIGLVFLGLSFFYLTMYSQVFVIANKYEGILYLGFALGALITFLTTVSKANSYLFESKDFDLLISLPVKPQVIIASKISSLVLMNYMICLFFYLPTITLYGIYARPGMGYYFVVLPLLLLYPLIIITLCSIVSYLMNLMLKRIKRKNAFQTIFMVIFFLAVMVASMSLSTSMSVIEGNDMEAVIAMAEQMQSIMSAIFYPSRWMVGALQGSLASFAIFAAISVIPFVVFIIILGRNFVRAQGRSKMTYTNSNFVLNEGKVASPTKALLVKEAKSLFSHPNVFLNTAIGPLMSTFMLAFFLITSNSFGEEMDFSALPKDLIVSILIAALTFFGSIVSTTSSSISLEGKQFWIIKSAPLKVMDVFWAKMLLNLLIAVPSTIINTVIISIIFKPNVFYIAMSFILPNAINLIIGAFGLLINLLFPRMDWDNPVKVVKQSVSVMITMLGSMLLTGISIGVFVLMMMFGNFPIAYIVLTVVLSLIFIGVYWLLKTIGIKKFNSIQA